MAALQQPALRQVAAAAAVGGVPLVQQQHAQLLHGGMAGLPCRQHGTVTRIPSLRGFAADAVLDRAAAGDAETRAPSPSSAADARRASSSSAAAAPAFEPPGRVAPFPEGQPPDLPEQYERLGTVEGKYQVKPQAVFAVVEVGGTQYKVTPDDLIYTERLAGVDVNDKVALNHVLLLGSRQQTVVGRPYVVGARVTAVVEEQFLDAKVRLGEGQGGYREGRLCQWVSGSPLLGEFLQRMARQAWRGNTSVGRWGADRLLSRGRLVAPHCLTGWRWHPQRLAASLWPTTHAISLNPSYACPITPAGPDIQEAPAQELAAPQGPPAAADHAAHRAGGGRRGVERRGQQWMARECTAQVGAAGCRTPLIAACPHAANCRLPTCR